MIYDFCIIGGGIVGLATAMELLKRQPNASLVILEKKPRWPSTRPDITAG